MAVNLAGDYYSFTVDNTANQAKAIHSAMQPIPPTLEQEIFLLGSIYNAPQYSQTLCMATGIDNDGTTSSVTAQADESL